MLVGWAELELKPYRIDSKKENQVRFKTLPTSLPPSRNNHVYSSFFAQLKTTVNILPHRP